MSKFTKFLNLFIPGKTDKGSVVTDVFEPNFSKIDDNAESTDLELKRLEKDKLDKGLVSEEYNTAKKIEEKIKEAKKAGTDAGTEANKKLDKGNVQTKYDTAEKIGNEIDKKFDKTGGTISGAVTVTGNIIGNTMTLNGLLTANDIYLISDKRLKTNLHKIENPLKKLKKINGYTFNWILNNGSSGGVIAQELKEVMPSLVYESGGYYKVNYNGVIALLIESNKELIKEIEILKGKVR